MDASIVRTATEADKAEIWRLFLMAHRENGIFNLDPIKVENLINRAIFSANIPTWDQGPRGHIGVIGEPGKLEAIVFLLIGQFWYSSDMHLEELVVFVDPECRKSGHAKAIIAWMKKTALVLGIPLLTGIISKDRTEAKIRLYDRYLPRIGAFFLFPIDGVDVKKRNQMDRKSWKEARRLQ